MFGASSTTGATAGGSSLGRSASFSFSQPPATKPFAGSTGTFSFGNNSSTSTTNAQPTGTAATGGLFGSTNTQQQQPQQQQAGAQQGTTTTGGLFGAKPAGTGGFSFGTTQQQPQQQQGATTGAGLFGASTSGAGAGGLFGQKPAATNTTTGAGGLFGQPAAQASNTAGGGGLFGASTNSTLGGGGGLFGASTSSNLGGGTTGGGLFGQSTFQPAASQQQQQQLQQQAAAQSPFLRFGYQQRERYNDLPEDARKLVEELDKHISSQLQIKDELKTRDFGAEIRKCAAEWQELDSALTSLSATLEHDYAQSRDVAERVERDRSDQATLYAVATNAREGRSDGAGFVEWLQTYFAKLADDFRSRIARYRSSMEDIERHLAGLERRDGVTPQAISDAIHAQHTSFMALAAEVAGLHAQVDTLKRDFTKWYAQTHRSYRDPFASMSSLASSVAP